MKDLFLCMIIFRPQNVLAVALLMASVFLQGVAPAKAIINFQDDTFHEIPSEGLIINSDDGGVEDVFLQLGNDGSDVQWSFNDTSGDVTMTAPNHILFDLQSTGDVIFQDNGTDFALFRDDALFELTAAEDTERIRLTDETNADSVGLYTGLGSPDTSLNAEAGSLFLDQEGQLYVNDSTGSGTAWNRFVQRPGQVVTVAKRGGDFDSIKAAIDSITTASSSNPFTVLVYPGVYDEDPITMQSFVDVVAVGGPAVSTIAATTAASDLITMATDSMLMGFTVDGVTAGACVNVSAVLRAQIRDLLIEDCQYGVQATGASTEASVRKVRHDAGIVTDVIRADSGAQLSVSDLTVKGGTPTTVLFATGSGSLINADGLISTATGVVNGLYVDDSAQMTAHSVTIDAATNAARIGSTGSNSLLQTSAALFQNSDSYDVLVESSSAQMVLSGGAVDRNKVSVPAGLEQSLLFNDQTEGDEGAVVLGSLAVGAPENPTEASFGEGDAYTDGMLVYTETSGGSFTDVSSAATSRSGSTFTFSGTAADNAVYLSTDRTDDQGSLVPFFGYQLLMSSTALTLGGGAVVHEYWNGSAWTPFTVFCSHATLLHRYGDSCFLRASTEEQVRFDASIGDDWAQNDPPTTGTNRYWVRMRVETAVTTAPVFEQFQIHPNQTTITKGGSLTLHGDARERRAFVTNPELIFSGKGNNAPDNASFNVGAIGQWVDDRDGVSFSGNGNQLEEISGSITLPRGIDSSSDLRARIYWKKTDTDAGNVQWKLDYLVAGTRNNPVANGSSVTPADRSAGDDVTVIDVVTVETTPEGGIVEGEVISQLFTADLDISGAYEGDTIFLRLYRDAGDADDTYTSDAVLTGFEIEGVFWTDGKNLD